MTERVRGKPLFLLIMNNSGSTMLSGYLQHCKNVALLSGGQVGEFFFSDNLGPDEVELGVSRIWSRMADVFEDPRNYNWPRIKQVWNTMWRNSVKRKGIKGRPILLENSTPNISRGHMLAKQFPGAHFLVMIRDPYAVCEGINRRGREGLHRKDDLNLEECAQHWVYCARWLREYIRKYERCIWFTYEQLVSDTEAVRAKIVEFLPELSDLDFSKKVSSHAVDGTAARPLQDYNEKQLKRLTPRYINLINSVLKHETELLSFFGYKLRKPGK